MICGDFNMTPDSALYNYMVRGALDMDGLNRWVLQSMEDQESGPSPRDIRDLSTLTTQAGPKRQFDS